MTAATTGWRSSACSRMGSSKPCGRAQHDGAIGASESSSAPAPRESCRPSLPIGAVIRRRESCRQTSSTRTTQNSFSVADFVRRTLRLEGPRGRQSLACSSSAKVFGIGAAHDRGRADRRGRRRRVSTRCALRRCTDFNSLQLTSRDPCRPFDVARDGISIGEAAAFALLEPPSPEPGCERRHVCSASASRATRTTCRRPTRRAWARASRCRRRSQRRPSSRAISTTSICTAPARQATTVPRPAPSTACLALRRAMQLHQGRDRPHAGRGRRTRGRHLRACPASSAWSRRRQYRAGRSDSEGSLRHRERRRAALPVLSNSFGFGGTNCASSWGARADARICPVRRYAPTSTASGCSGPASTAGRAPSRSSQRGALHVHARLVAARCALRCQPRSDGAPAAS